MPRDAKATRARILAAATGEFSAHGLAGGRVDRIAAAARANKRAIYDYFGSKDELFDLVVRRVTDDIIDTVPAPRGDLSGYTASLFDYLLDHPEAQRLLSWRRLERPDAVPQLAAQFVRDLRLDDARSDAGAMLDLAILAIGMANAWDLSGPDLCVPQGATPTAPNASQPTATRS